MYLNGSIQIICIHNMIVVFCFCRLQASNIEISSVVSFCIVGDGYSEDYFKHKLNKPSVSLTYLEENKSISLLDKVTNNCTSMSSTKIITLKCTFFWFL